MQEIDALLGKWGLLKVSLGFEDEARDEGSYLERLLLSLHKYHGHGLPITHSASRGWFWDVRPVHLSTGSQDGSNGGERAARSETMAEFPWHTDCSYERCPPRYFALQVVQPDRCGGGTLSLLNAASIVSLLSPTTVAELRKHQFRIAVPPEFVKSDDDNEILGSVLRVDHGSQHRQVRIRQDITSGLTAEAEAALEELQLALQQARSKGRVLDLPPVVLPRGSVVLIDNRRWLHARNQVRDPNRHLRRVRWDAQPFDG